MVFPDGGPGTPHGPALAGALERLRQHQAARVSLAYGCKTMVIE
jgi:hypothetical protein